MGQFKGRRPAPSLDNVAGNGLINRRALLGQGFAIAGAGAVATATGASAEPLKDSLWSLEMGGPTPALQTPSPFEKEVTQTLSNPKTEFPPLVDDWKGSHFCRGDIALWRIGMAGFSNLVSGRHSQ